LTEPSSAPRTSGKIVLDGVPETLLWPLYNRAAFASRPGALLQDPRAVQIRDAIDYPFARHFGKPNEAHALRALRFDDEVRRFLSAHPDGTVVALGEGLETGFWRVDNGRVRWLAVDLPETIALRSRWLPDTDRHKSLACSALDFRWMDEVDRSRGVFLMAEGLLMYFEPRDVERLLAACAERFPGSEMMFDVIPRWLSQKTLRGWHLTKHYRTPPMPWGIDVSEQAGLRAIHPNIVAVREVDIGRGQGFAFGFLIPLLSHIPMPASIANKRPAFVVLRFGVKSFPASRDTRSAH
jgi:O-methyltransferase involved in polyketide biosynthesis